MPAKTSKTSSVLEHLIKYKKVYLVILLLVILSSPYFIRYLNSNPTVIGESSYFHLNQAENNPYQNPYHLLLSLNSTHNPIIYQVIPLILAAFSLLLLFNLTKKINPQKQFFFLLFLILSPAFIYTFTTLNHYSFVIFLILLGFTLLFSKIKYLSYPVFAIIPFFDIFSSVLTLLFLATYFYLKKDQKIKTIASLIVILTFFNIFLKKPFLLGPYLPQNIFIDFFSDLGGLFGISLFALLLAITGLMVTWKKEKFFLIYLFTSLFILLSLYQTSILIYLNFFLIFLAAFGFTYFLNKEWKLNLIRNIFLFLLLLGLVFSTISSLDKISNLPPSPEIKESMMWLNKVSEPDEVIFSHPQNSYFIEYFAQRSAFLTYHSPNFETGSNTADQIFESTYIKETFPLLEQNNISFIYLPQKTKEDLPLDRGLLFLFKNERFKRAYDKEDIEIWKFKKE